MKVEVQSKGHFGYLTSNLNLPCKVLVAAFVG